MDGVTSQRAAVERYVHLATTARLRPVVEHHACIEKYLGLEFLLAMGVRTHGVDVRPWLHPLAPDNRLANRRGGADDVAPSRILELTGLAADLGGEGCRSLW